MSATIPLFYGPRWIDSADGPHFRITYSDASTEDFTLGTSGGSWYYPDDLRTHVEAVLNATSAYTWSVSEAAGGLPYRMELFMSAAPVTPSNMTRLGTWSLRYFGFTISDSGSASFSGTTLTGAYQQSLIWTPGDILTKQIEGEGETFGSEVTFRNGDGIDWEYGGHSSMSLFMPAIKAVRILTALSEVSEARTEIDGLQFGDPNFALQAFLSDLRDQCKGRRPIIEYYPDADDTPFYQLRIVKRAFRTLPGVATLVEEQPALYDVLWEFACV